MTSESQVESQKSILEALAANLTTGELRALNQAVSEVLRGQGYGEIQLDIRAHRVFLISIKTTRRPVPADEEIG